MENNPQDTVDTGNFIDFPQPDPVSKETIIVTVMDNDGNLETGIISAYCPICGARRGALQRPIYWEGEYSDCTFWRNECKHIDTFESVLREARAMEKTQQDVMTVTVMYRNSFFGGDGWTYYPTRITISAFCPVCGKQRGLPRWYNLCEDGEWFSVQVWDNPCGHKDMYSDVLKEAEYKK